MTKQEMRQALQNIFNELGKCPTLGGYTVIKEEAYLGFKNAIAQLHDSIQEEIRSEEVVRDALDGVLVDESEPTVAAAPKAVKPKATKKGGRPKGSKNKKALKTVSVVEPSLNGVVAQ